MALKKDSDEENEVMKKVLLSSEREREREIHDFDKSLLGGWT